MNDCVFCKIVKGELPSYKTYEDEKFLAFLDINPVVDGHTLIVPKKHIPYMQDADNQTVAEIFKTAQKLEKVLKDAFKCKYVEIVVEGEQVAHFHVHLIPRMLNDGLPKFPTKTYKEGEAQEIVKKITSAL